MAHAKDTAALLRQNLQDAGCPTVMSWQVVRYVEAGSVSCALCLLRQHKQTLLHQLHADEQRIDSLDYLIYTLSQSTTTKG